MKRLLVLAAGILQIPIICRAREMGYYVIAADGDDSAPGLSYANQAIVANITSEEEMLQIARQERIDGVIHPCSEVAMHVMGRINDELGLSGIGRDTALRATNKWLMREAFEKGNAPSPRCFCTISVDEAWQLFSQNFLTDAILKPSRNSGSRGIAKVARSISRDEFKILYERAYRESRDKSVLIEEFVEGPEFSVEIIVWQGQVNVLAVTDKKTTGAPYFVELGHSQPSMFAPDAVEVVKQAAIAGVKALGLNNCATHAEVKLQAGKAYLMEIGARLGGDFISTVLTRLSTGVDMVAAAVNVALGLAPDLCPVSQPQGVCIRYFCPTQGRILSISNLESLQTAKVYAYEIYRAVGDHVPEIKSSLDRSGHVIVVGNTAHEAVQEAERMINSVYITTS